MTAAHRGAWGAAALAGLGLAAGSCHPPKPHGPIGPIESAPSLAEVSDATRRDYLRHAQVWRPIATASLDLKAGPDLPGRFPWDAPVTCDYFESGHPLSGLTPKFLCKAGGDVLKVKYGEDNGEVYAETAATRLFWALGFGADGVYPVRLTCRGCPVDPWLWRTSERHDAKEYPRATIERKFPGEAIESKRAAGWSWAELDTVDSSAGGAPAAHREALKLLAVLVQHGDNKPGQQRLVCPPEAVRKTASGVRCDRPFLVVSDLGATFGGAGDLSRNAKAKMRYAHWSSKRVFKDQGRCIGDLDGSFTGDLENPRIRESGRRFLAERLALLSDDQIRDLFAAAHADARGETIEADGTRRPVTIDEWVIAFKTKRREIAERRCPE